MFTYNKSYILSPRTNMIYYYQTPTSDGEQQLNVLLTTQCSSVHSPSSWHSTDTILPSVTPGAVAAPPSAPRLAADLFQRVSVRRLSDRQLAAFSSCI